VTRLRPACLGRKLTLSKYTKFYIVKHLVLESTDANMQDISRFVVCQACFSTYISRSPHFLESFEEYKFPDADSDEPAIPTNKGICEFWLLTVTHIFNQCLYQRSIDSLIEVAKKKRLGHCLHTYRGNGAVSGGELFTAKSIPNDSVCLRCHRISLKTNSFGIYFTKQTAESYWGMRRWKRPELCPRNFNDSH